MAKSIVSRNLFFRQYLRAVILKGFLMLMLLGSFMPLKADETLDSLWQVWQDNERLTNDRFHALNELTWEYYMYSQTDSAIYFGMQLLDFSTEQEYKLGMGKALNLLGVAYKKIGNYPKAIDYYMKSLTIKEEIGYTQGLPATLSNIGVIYSFQGEYEMALEYNQRALALREELGDRKGMSSSYINIGNTYYRKKEFEKALVLFNKALLIKEDFNDSRGVALCLINIGSCYRDLGMYDKALTNFERARMICEEIDDKYLLADCYFRIGREESDKENYTKAITNCEEALRVATDIGSIVEQKYASECLYSIYKELKMGSKALFFHEMMIKLEDSLKHEETTKKLQNMQFAKQVFQDSIATAEKERLVKEAHKEEMRKEEKTRNIGFASAFMFLVIAGGYYSRWRYVRRSKAVLQIEKDRSENLLLNILPEEIAEELKTYGKAEARDFDLVSILFTDFKGFTEQSARMSAGDLVSEINFCFEAFDGIIEKYKVEKIKTIGDAYMAAGGLPLPSDDSVKNTVLAALEMQEFISKRKAKNDAENKPAFEMRVGIHTGPVVAGIVGVKKFQYDIWGDTVNTASRIESNGQSGKVNISQATYGLIKDNSDFAFESRGKIEAKGKGTLQMYFVTKKASQNEA